MKNFFSGVFYYLNLAWVRALIAVITTREIIDKDNVPKRGALIIVSNHLNNADSPILTATIPRRIRWLTKIEWFSAPLVGWMFKWGGMIPVRRFDADVKAIRACEKALQHKQVLGMFPEGTRSKTGAMQTAELGTALIALRTGALIQPVAIWGTEKVRLPRDLIGRTHAHVRFGKPFTLVRKEKVTREEVTEAATTIMKAIAALLPEKYRGVYAEALTPSPSPTVVGEGRAKETTN